MRPSDLALVACYGHGVVAIAFGVAVAFSTYVRMEGHPFGGIAALMILAVGFALSELSSKIAPPDE